MFDFHHEMNVTIPVSESLGGCVADFDIRVFVEAGQEYQDDPESIFGKATSVDIAVWCLPGADKIKSEWVKLTPCCDLFHVAMKAVAKENWDKIAEEWAEENGI